MFLTGQREVQTLVQRLQQTFDRSGQCGRQRRGQSGAVAADDALFGADAADVEDGLHDALYGDMQHQAGAWSIEGSTEG